MGSRCDKPVARLAWLLPAALACAAPAPEPRLWTVPETHDRFDGLELRLARGRHRIALYRDYAAFIEARRARRAAR